MCLVLLEAQASDIGQTSLTELNGLFFPQETSSAPARRPFGGLLTGGLMRAVKLAPKQEATVTFLLTWHMPNLKMDRLPPGRNYAKRFESATDVARHVARHFARLSGETRLWHDTWYDSTLALLVSRSNVAQHLDPRHLHLHAARRRSFLGLGRRRVVAMAPAVTSGSTPTAWRGCFPTSSEPRGSRWISVLRSNRMARFIFAASSTTSRPSTARPGRFCAPCANTRCRADDALSEAQLAADQAGDGMVDREGRERRRPHRGNQHNTLDTDWYGPVAWLSGLYLAALGRRRGDGARGGRSGVRRQRAAPSSPAGRARHRCGSCSTASTSSTSLIRSISTPSTRGPAATSTRSWGRVGPSRSGLARVLPESETRVGAEGASGATTSRRTSGPTATPTSRGAGTPCRARAAC